MQYLFYIFLLLLLKINQIILCSIDTFYFLEYNNGVERQRDDIIKQKEKGRVASSLFGILKENFKGAKSTKYKDNN